MNTIKILVITLLVTSCSHRMQVRTPVFRFLSPESQGKIFATEGDLSVSFGNKATVSFENDKTTNELQLNKEGDLASVQAQMGIFPFLDAVAYYRGPLYSNLMMGLKLQVLGKSRREAKQGDHALSISFLGGHQSTTEEEGEDLELTAMDEDSSATVTTKSYDAVLTYGYRFADKTLAFAGIGSTYHHFSGKLTSENTALDNKRLAYRANAVDVNLGIIHYIKVHQHLKFEIVAQRLKWTHTDETKNMYANIAYGLNW